MTIYNDAIGNYFLGNLDLGTPIDNGSYIAIEFNPTGGISLLEVRNELGTLATNAGLQWRDVLVTNTLGEWGSTDRLIYFGASTDSINDRYAFQVLYGVTSNSTSRLPTMMWNDSGAPGTTITTTGIINYIGNVKNTTVVGDYYRDWGSGASKFCICANSQSMSLFGYNILNDGLVANKLCWGFQHAGLLTNINPALGYTSIIDRSVVIASSIGGVAAYNNFNGYYTVAGPSALMDNLLCVALYNNGTRKLATTTGNAAYNFTFSSGTQTGKMWATDLVVYDGSTYVGKVQNMLITDGFFIPGVPIRLRSTLKPDNGSNLWIPVGKFAGRTALARFYSSTMPV